MRFALLQRLNVLHCRASATVVAVVVDVDAGLVTGADVVEVVEARAAADVVVAVVRVLAL